MNTSPTPRIAQVIGASGEADELPMGRAEFTPSKEPAGAVALMERAHFFVREYALKNTRWTDSGGVEQDPNGANALLSKLDQFLAALGAAVDTRPLLGSMNTASLAKGIELCRKHGHEGDAATLEELRNDLKTRQLSACNFCLAQAAEARAAIDAREQELIDWVVARWHAEVANRPLVNVHRRSLDGAWRQMLRHFGVDDRARLGPTHDDLLEQRAPEPDDTPLETGEGDAR
jgi:hypothetical protein